MKTIRDQFQTDSMPNKKGVFMMIFGFVPVVIYRIILGNDLIMGDGVIGASLIIVGFIVGSFVFLKGDKYGFGTRRYTRYTVLGLTKEEYDLQKSESVSQEKKD